MEKNGCYMKETKDYPQSEADQDFAKLLKNIRTEENVSLQTKKQEKHPKMVFTQAVTL